ncbi:hypothetical protein NBRGN_037_00170 [Nocardia brasiliensis NBRC 14402]|uniref:hypothetical protein n=1 Tax=Nocardia brasiliensis TaxID=37326 RepID=UPI0003083168|nr:hypothetical protein [Nocardia brasiliensis]GAJ81257.1 hypothetical protein NBRGN_037_00170 [Nocardia brasiliensis NBRC 14402]SUB54013.1 Uncharacterised protein [Nocardia brasiliensis]
MGRMVTKVLATLIIAAAALTGSGYAAAAPGLPLEQSQASTQPAKPIDTVQSGSASTAFALLLTRLSSLSGKPCPWPACAAAATVE